MIYGADWPLHHVKQLATQNAKSNGNLDILRTAKRETVQFQERSKVGVLFATEMISLEMSTRNVPGFRRLGYTDDLKMMCWCWRVE